MKRTLLLPLILVAAAGCGERESGGIDSLMKEGLFADSIPVETLTLARQDFEETFDAAGIVEAEENVTVSAEISGRIVEIHREMGDVVDAGDWLVSLDKRQINARIRKIEAQLARANTQLEWSRRDLGRQVDPWAAALHSNPLGAEALRRNAIASGRLTAPIAAANLASTGGSPLKCNAKDSRRVGKDRWKRSRCTR